MDQGMPNSLIERLSDCLEPHLLERGAAEGQLSLQQQLGNSLQCASMAVELSRVSGTPVLLKDLFDYRTVAELAQRIAARAHHQPNAASHHQQLTPSRIRRRSALSFSQERMAFMQGIAGITAAYHACFSIEISGNLEFAQLEQALRSLPKRNSQLRMRFVSLSDGVSCLPTRNETLAVQTLREEHASEARLAAIATEFANAPFDLEKGETARALIIAVTHARCRVVFSFHHIVMDAWAFELLLEDVAREYARLVSQQPAMDRAEADYAAYAQWHRRWFREYAFDRDLAYWREQLDGSERTTIEPDFVRPAAASYRGDRVAWRPAPDIWQRLDSEAGKARVTTAAWLFATFALWLRSFTSRNDLTLGLAVANRHHAFSGDVLGTLVNLLPLRIATDPSASFSSFVQLVQQQLLAALDHQDMPFEVLVRQLRLERSSAESPLIGTLFNLLNVPPRVTTLGSAAIRRVEVDRKASQFDLTLTIDAQHECTFWFEFATDLYARKTIELAAERFASLLESVLGNPDTLISALPIRAAEESRLVAAWGRGPSLPLPATGLAHWLAQSFKRGADGIAVIDRHNVLTYRDLHALTTSFVAGLRSIGVHAGNRVGLMLDRSCEAAIAMVGCLRAGVAFVPLDPEFPEQRLTYVIGDSGIDCILRASALPVPEWASRHDLRWLNVLDVAHCDAAGVDHYDAGGQLPAYVLYTSGSSGRPKGVEVPQQALLNLLVGMKHAPGMTGDDRLLAVTTWGFDISLLEILLPLVSGARVVIAARDQVLDGPGLASLIDTQRITMLQATPATWIQLIESGWSGTRNLRALVGGEALTAELAGRLHERTGELWNMYGPTETTIWSTCQRVTVAGSGIVPLGRPIANTQVIVQCVDGHPAGIGTTGEIAIGGTGVALGYVGQPELTAERFSTSVDGPGRFYRTGDLGRWTSTGQLEFRGRADRQLKLRGFRIEPGEIEAVATSVRGVERAALVHDQPGTLQARLALHVQSTTEREPLLDALRAHLASRLPEYMVPQLIHVHARLPLLPNGKLDGSALRLAAPSGAATSPEEPFVDELEQRLAQIWEDLLDVRSVGRHDNFFHCGGHSLLAMRLVARVREDLGRQCTLQQVFQAATLAALAQRLRAATPLQPSRVVSLRIGGDGAPLYCICGVLIYRQLAQHLPEGFPVRAVYVPMDQDRRSVEDLAQGYVDEIRQEQPKGPYRMLGFSFGGVLAFEIGRQLIAAGETVECIHVLDSDPPGKSPLGTLKEIWSGLRAALTGDESASDRVPDYVLAMRAYRAGRIPCRVLFVQAQDASSRVAPESWRALSTDFHSVSVKAGHLELLQDPAVYEVAAAVGVHLGANAQAVPERPGTLSSTRSAQV
jgi:amino acid adenylation domain-containing protein